MTIASQLAELVEQRQTSYHALADQLWDNPELRWQEYAAFDRHVALAEQSGLRVQRRVAGIPTAFSAESGTDGPLIAFLGEYDALAGMSQRSGTAFPEANPETENGGGHGCGHHLLGAASLLAAASVSRYLTLNRLPGRVRYYGCPAEEAAAGKTFMVNAGAFDDVDAAVSWHPADTTGVICADTLACCQVYFRFTGVAAHAGESPHLGRSALDAAELMNVGVNFLREHMPSDCRVHYAIVDAGGASPNVVQSHATAFYIVRGPTVAAMRSLYERVVKIAEGAALMTQTSLDVDFDGASSELRPNRVLDEAMHGAFGALGPVPFSDDDQARADPFRATLGAAQLAAALRQHPTVDRNSALHTGVLPLADPARRATSHGSTDVGDVSWVVPTVQCTVACAAFGTPAHSWQLVAQGKLGAAHRGMTHAAKVMALTATKLLTDSDLLARATGEFRGQLKDVPYDSPIPAGVLAPPLRDATA